MADQNKPQYMTNEVAIEGYVAQAPVLKTTSTGKQVASAVIINHFGKQQSRFLLEGWNDEAAKVAALEVGQKVKVNGTVTVDTNQKDGKYYTTVKLTAVAVKVTRQAKAKDDAGLETAVA